jgi:hypothetical protein
VPETWLTSAELLERRQRTMADRNDALRRSEAPEVLVEGTPGVLVLLG